MSHILRHFSLHAAKWNGVIEFALLIVWAGVIACVISSILAQPFDRKQRLFWIAIVILLPVVGVLSYLPFSFRKEELPHIFLRRKKPHKRNKPHESRSES